MLVEHGKKQTDELSQKEKGKSTFLAFLLNREREDSSLSLTGGGGEKTCHPTRHLGKGGKGDWRQERETISSLQREKGRWLMELYPVGEEEPCLIEEWCPEGSSITYVDCDVIQRKPCLRRKSPQDFLSKSLPIGRTGNGRLCRICCKEKSLQLHRKKTSQYGSIQTGAKRAISALKRLSTKQPRRYPPLLKRLASPHSH